MSLLFLFAFVNPDNLALDKMYWWYIVHLWVEGTWELVMAFAVVMVWKGRRDHANKAALLWSLGCGTLTFFGAGVWGFLHRRHGVNYYSHGTQITAAHGHLAFYGAYVCLNLAIISDAMPQMRGRDPYNQRR